MNKILKPQLGRKKNETNISEPKNTSPVGSSLTFVFEMYN